MGLLPANVLSQLEIGSTYDVVLVRRAMNVWYAMSYAHILQLFDPIHQSISFGVRSIRLRHLFYARGIGSIYRLTFHQVNCHYKYLGRSYAVLMFPFNLMPGQLSGSPQIIYGIKV